MNRSVLRPIVLILVASFGSFLGGLAWRLSQDPALKPQLSWAIGIAFVLAVIAWRAWHTLDNWLPKLRAYCLDHSEAIENMPDKHMALWIALAAALGLYAELTIIRLHAEFYQLFAHFKNVSLLSCFLGLGIGYALKQDKDKPLTTPLAVPLLCLEVVLTSSLLRVFDLNFLILNPTSEQATMGLFNAQEIADMMLSYGLLIFVFVLNAICFIPFGQIAARLMSRKPKLESYSLNLIGSLAGIALLFVLSLLWTPPAVWFLFILLGMIPFLIRKGGFVAAVTTATITIALLAVPMRIFRLDIHSPYQIISVILESENPRLFSNNTWFQTMLDLRPEKVANREDLKPMEEYYGLAYKFKPAPKNVLVVGSGSGNDVASALRHGAEHVDAVEIDPAIIEVGKNLHPEQPYGNPKVTVHNDDARSFIKRTQNKYDLIVYGLLDSATSMSGNSAGMRMDSYVWTLEAFQEAKSKLTEDGIISMSACIYAEMGPKLFRMLTMTFNGPKPYVYKTNWDAGFTFLIGDKLQKPADFSTTFDDLTDEFTTTSTAAEISTDDWPFLFMFKRAYPFSYMSVILVLLVITAILVYRTLPDIKKDFSFPCFFLGAGFMLIETKGITQLALVYGSTWVVTSVVIAAILILAYLANLVVLRLKNPPPVILTYGLIVLSLLVGVWMCDMSFANLSVLQERLIMTIGMTMPLFFSGLAFSREVSETRSISIALSSNLLGAMLGGFLEYNALYFGYKSLFYFALVLYVLAFAFALRKK